MIENYKNFGEIAESANAMEVRRPESNQRAEQMVIEHPQTMVQPRNIGEDQNNAATPRIISVMNQLKINIPEKEEIFIDFLSNLKNNDQEATNKQESNQPKKAK